MGEFGDVGNLGDLGGLGDLKDLGDACAFKKKMLHMEDTETLDRCG